MKLHAFRSTTVLKRDPNTGFSCEICEIFKSALFYRTLFFTEQSQITSSSFMFCVVSLRLFSFGKYFFRVECPFLVQYSAMFQRLYNYT